ncbi:MAG: nucleotidyltransferase domain-containing protein [Nanoarchaeota archaeon]|nr:nucleotidyltransferase domain-containing protein [Nanoarchaeota archaeon]MBU1005391.1 nucleotidyltransferase domain-containing protein [Nanoarchaeota archaeon]MBU1945673.1 nucleotidyltransferase domain-containing protein [Nanoarchaeota archaeon]
MKADFESAISDVKQAFSEFKGVLAVILFGSVARGDFSRRHSDLDLFVVIGKKKVDDKLKKRIDECISSICLKHAVRSHLEFQGLDIKSEDRTLLEKMIEEGKVIYSSGVFVFDNNMIGLKQYILYSFSSKDSAKKTLFSKALHGKRSWYYKKGKKIVKEYSGIIDSSSVISVGKGGLLVSKDRKEAIESMFSSFGVKFKIVKIVYG